MVTDDAGSPSPIVALDVPVRVDRIGRPRARQPGDRGARGPRRSLRPGAAAVRERRQLLGTRIATRRLQILADGSPVTARDLALEPRVRTAGRHRRAARRRAQRRGAPDPARRPGADAGPADLLPRRRRGVGRRARRPAEARAAGRTGQRLPPERAHAAAQRRAVRRNARRVAGPHRQGALRPGRVRRLPAAPSCPHKPILAIAPPRSSATWARSAAPSSVRHGPAAGRRAAAARRGPDPAPRRASAATSRRRMGTRGPALGCRGAAHLQRPARGPADRGHRLRPAPERPAAPGGLADPDLQRHGRAARASARSGPDPLRAVHARRAPPAARRGGRARDAARRDGRAGRAGRFGRVVA